MLKGIAAEKMQGESQVQLATPRQLRLMSYFIPTNIWFANVLFRSEDVDVMITASEYDKNASALQEMLYATCDYAHDRCVKVRILNFS